MSKAFTKEDDGPAAPHLPSRAPLPKGQLNYVTPTGLAKLESELRELQAETARLAEEPPSEDRARSLAVLAHRRSALDERLGSARVVKPEAATADRSSEVRFGAWVTVREERSTASPGTGGGSRRVHIVGVDEADAGLGLIAFVSPLAQALLGRTVGETAQVRTPRGEETWEIVALTYDEP